MAHIERMLVGGQLGRVGKDIGHRVEQVRLVRILVRRRLIRQIVVVDPPDAILGTGPILVVPKGEPRRLHELVVERRRHRLGIED